MKMTHIYMTARSKSAIVKTCGQRDLVLSNNCVVLYPLEKTWLQFYNNRKFRVKCLHSENQNQRYFGRHRTMCAYLPFGGTGLLVIQMSLIILYTSDDSFKIHSCVQEKGQQRMWSAPGSFALADMWHLVIQQI